MTKHAYLSASSSHRWLNCTVAPSLESSYPDTSSNFAAEGTLAHEIGELILLGKEKKIEKLKEDELFYEGMVDEVEDYTNYCKERFAELRVADPLAQMFIEERLNFSNYVPEGFGTGDCVLIGNGLLEIIDLKFGKGVEVDAKDNSQLMLYALGALDACGFLYDIDKVRMTIAQVRLGGISSYEMKVKDLAAWGEEIVKPNASLAYDGKGDANPGSWCGFCKFKNNCKAKADYELEIVDRYKGKDKLSKEEISEILERAKDIKSWLNGIEDYALDEALTGVNFPGFKLVEGRSNRKINDEDGLANALLGLDFTEEEIFKPRTINTITNLEKLVGKKKFTEFSEFIIKPSGKPTLVPVSDKRKELNSIEDDFDFN